MYDIVIAVLCFPNDPTKNMAAHQMFVGEQTDSGIDLYSVSSVLGKERRVYGNDKDNYVIINYPESIQNGFKVPSFVDCSKMYRVFAGKNCDLSLLSHRQIAKSLRERIEERIEEMKTSGKHVIYTISENDFCSWNLRAKV